VKDPILGEGGFSMKDNSMAGYRTGTLLGLLVAAGFSSGVKSQGDELPFTIRLQEVTWRAAPGLQSYAVAQDQHGRWLCFSGRTAGLHGRQDDGEVPPPPSNFENFNDRVWVIDLAGPQAVSRTLPGLGLSDELAASLAVTGPEYVQVGDKLYMAGGYGYSADHTFMKTYRQLTIIDVAATVDAVLKGTRIGDHIRQTTPDEWFRVTGGELGYLDGTFFLILGQRFDANYTPKSSAGQYTFQVRPFAVVDDGKSVAVVKGTPLGCAAADPEFRRRDLNVARGIRPDGRPGLTVFGGVFTRDDGVWYRPIDIDVQGGQMTVTLDASGFQQQLCQYNCAVLPIHQTSTRSMYTVFFGGISELYYLSNVPSGFKRDSGLPFVDHVGCIKKSAADTAEWLVCQGAAAGRPVPLRLPDLLGTAARFLPRKTTDPEVSFDDGVLDLDKIQADRLVGHIYGGIAATRSHNGYTRASNRIFEIHVSPRPAPAIPVPAGSRIPQPQTSPQRQDP
jgi:hypothetical protein